MRKEKLHKLTPYVIADAYFLNSPLYMEYFHFNASLTNVNLAKVKTLEKGAVLSIASVKMLSHNLFCMQRFIPMLGIKPNQQINQKRGKEGIEFTAIAA